MLEVNGIDVYYGVIHALKNVSLKVQEGEIVTLIGANGAGKTTALRTVSGLIKPSKGSIYFRGGKISGINPQEIVAKGISHVPEGRHVFYDMSVSENLELGAFLRRDKDGIKDDYEMIYSKFPILKDRSKQRAGTLSGGEQQMLAIGRALMSRPKLLLMDEPSMGLAPLLVHEIFSIIKEINNQGTTILLVEQNANIALSIAHRAYVIEIGSVVIEGTGKELVKSEEIKKAYLGG
ncbi:MAG TPA: ABC transporter ATP-binding protein [Clostridiales bacterium]|nr:ABC transporter ATP-binding protein [Clostridiales bacterium]